MHEAILALAQHLHTIRNLADDIGSNGLKAGIIGAVALVLSTALPVMLSKREREPKAVRDLRATELLLRRRLETERDDAVAKLAESQTYVAWLQQQVITLGGNPFRQATEAGDHGA